ncbi:flavodoxin domain-containing protein [Thalassiella azotivora]
MRVLVSAAGRHGATEEIAAQVADVLRSEGLDVDLRPPADVGDLTGVDAVVLGSGVYAGRWVKDARRAVDRLTDLLDGRPVWLFSSGPLGDPPAPDPDDLDVGGVVARTRARGHAVFAGRLDRHGLNLAERAAVRAVKAPEGDFRDWSAVRAWASEVAAELREGQDPR